MRAGRFGNPPFSSFALSHLANCFIWKSRTLDVTWRSHGGARVCISRALPSPHFCNVSKRYGGSRTTHGLHGSVHEDLSMHADVFTRADIVTRADVSVHADISTYSIQTHSYIQTDPCYTHTRSAQPGGPCGLLLASALPPAPA